MNSLNPKSQSTLNPNISKKYTTGSQKRQRNYNCEETFEKGSMNTSEKNFTIVRPREPLSCKSSMRPQLPQSLQYNVEGKRWTIAANVKE